MGYSRENSRQNEALQSILDGRTPEKRIFVPVEDKEFKEKMKLEITLTHRIGWKRIHGIGVKLQS